ncbi:glutathione peroxidase [Candidatus Sumerlaeota bacterium]|nr:glutathione peroxidase [Candidatus Sumerlaeota bacterium]
MKNVYRICAAVAVVAMIGAIAPWRAKAGEAAKEGAQVLNTKMKDIDGKEVDLSKYKGKVVMIVNVASKCGFTPQYEQLEAIYEKYKDKGFVILGFPANDFGKQEPGPEAEIKEFCTSKFKVSFEMFSKITVKGDEAPQLYKDLTSKEKNGGFGGEIKWNFTKFLVGKDGKVVARYESKVKPDEPEVTAAIEKELGK